MRVPAWLPTSTLGDASLSVQYAYDVCDASRGLYVPCYSLDFPTYFEYFFSNGEKPHGSRLYFSRPFTLLYVHAKRMKIAICDLS